jgi:uncharacterized protein YecT (DUF1311 family)
MKISPREITGEVFLDEQCFEPGIKRSTSTIENLIENTMGSSVMKSEKGVNRFELPEPISKNIEVLWVECAKDNFGPSINFGPNEGSSNWIAILSEKQLAMRWYDNTVLLLKRLSPDQKPEPSFPCEHSKSLVEKEICSSHSLSALDKSVSSAYSILTNEYKETGKTKYLKAIQRSQRSWISNRNKCERGTSCLEKSMQKRLDELIEEMR